MENKSKNDIIEEKISDMIGKNEESINKLSSILRTLGLEERELPNSAITLNNKYNEIRANLPNDVSNQLSLGILEDLIRKAKSDN